MPSSPRTADRQQYLANLLRQMRPGDQINEVISVHFSPWDMIRDPRAIMGEAYPVNYRVRTHGDLLEEFNQLLHAEQSPEEAMPISHTTTPPRPPLWWEPEDGPLTEGLHVEQDHRDPPVIEPDIPVAAVEVTPSAPVNQRLAIPQEIYNSMVEIALIEGVYPRRQEEQIAEGVWPDEFIVIVHPETARFAMSHINRLSADEASNFQRGMDENRRYDGHVILRYSDYRHYFMLTPNGRNRTLPSLCQILTGRPPIDMASEAYVPYGCYVSDGGWPEAHTADASHASDVRRALYTYARNMLKIISDDYAQFSLEITPTPQHNLQVYCL